MTGFSTATKKIIKARSKDVCEVCGVRPATEMHHRQYRSRGGSDTAGNALHVCGWGNHTGCHGKAHSGIEGESHGWSIRSGFDPLLVPTFRRSDLTWWRLDDDGGKSPVNRSDAIEYMTLIGAIKSKKVA